MTSIITYTAALILIISTPTTSQSNECVFIDTLSNEYKLDLSALIGVESHYYAGYYNYTYTPCVNQQFCQNIYVGNVLASLTQNEAVDVFDQCWYLALWDNGAVQPSYNPTTQIWTFQYVGALRDCDPWGGRQTTINWHCNRNTEYEMTMAQETSTCHYRVDIDSFYACADAPIPYCKWYQKDTNNTDVTLDLNALSQTTIIGNDATNSELVFAYTPCRNATFCDEDLVMVKLQNISTSEGCKRYIGIWEDEVNGGVPEYDNGVWRFGYNNGESCNELTSELYIYWSCNPNITSYTVDRADVIDPCLYDIYISSALACV